MLRKTNWPERYDPTRSPIYALNEVDVNASVETVWRLLIDAEKWAKFYPQAEKVKITTGEPVLALGASYSWEAAGISMINTVKEFIPGERLSWDTVLPDRDDGSTGYHGWVLTPIEGGCNLLTEETLQGPVFVEQIVHKHPGKLYEFQKAWIDALARAAEAEAKATNT